MHCNRTGRLVMCLPLLFVPLSLFAQTQEATPSLIITYVEAPPAKAAVLAADLHAYAAQIENGPGKPQVTVLKELGRPNRMVVIEQWPGPSSPAYLQAANLLQVKVRTDAFEPIDRRLNHPLSPVVAKEPSKAFCVLMHVDVSPDSSSEVTKILQDQRSAVLKASGALGYEVALQDQRTNHFAVYEVWTSRAAYESYAATGAMADFRHRLGPFIGSPFDDRLYSTVGN
jgi:quinol monooxygenase YgiN